MKVSMADVNKRGNRIVNEVIESGEPAIIMKHGKPVAEIRPLTRQGEREQAIEYLSALQPVAVSTPVDEVIADGRQRGL